MIKLETPEFASEAEEAQWWFDHDDEIAGHFEKALKDGTLTRGTTLRRLGLAATNIVLDVQDADLARAQAAQRGLEYQAYLKLLIHEGLTKASQQMS